MRVNRIKNAVALAGKGALLAGALGGEEGLGGSALDMEKDIRPLGKGRLVLQCTGSFHSK